MSYEIQDEFLCNVTNHFLLFLLFFAFSKAVNTFCSSASPPLLWAADGQTAPPFWTVFPLAGFIAGSAPAAAEPAAGMI
jgi:hypothetical protein